MIGLEWPMPESCRDCPLDHYYTLSGEARCRAGNATLAENFEDIGFEGRPSWCPLIDLSAWEDDLK